jgi:hypothetical protein
MISSSKIDFNTTAPAPLSSRFLIFSGESVSPELPTIMGFLRVKPKYFVVKSTMVNYFFELDNCKINDVTG